ncbi:MAG: hypothetical protein DA408_13530 [Bacteroidetes bacterium]|nr:MAG: hypothetical protein C7N36_14015 [Bacteroidota bacterium]PTM11428.1 MAG: hypothetical protein DA408_13530 [Bacteroidota bacterium]
MAKKRYTFHGNSKKNSKDHHLYEIVDRIDDDIVKYGISAGEVDADGYSSRMREQVNFANIFVGWARFFARIILYGIKGRAKAEKIEQDHIASYTKKQGRRPRGNLK